MLKRCQLWHGPSRLQPQDWSVPRSGGANTAHFTPAPSQPRIPQPRDFPRELRGTEVTAAGSDGGGGSAGRGRGHEQPPAGDPGAAEAPPPAPGAAGAAGAGGPGRAGPGGPRRDFVFPVLQLGAENADSIGAVLNSKDEQREIAETRETCRSVSGGVPVQNWGLRAGTGPGDAVGLHLVKENPIISQIRAVTGTSRV